MLSIRRTFRSRADKHGFFLRPLPLAVAAEPAAAAPLPTAASEVCIGDTEEASDDEDAAGEANIVEVKVEVTVGAEVTAGMEMVLLLPMVMLLLLLMAVEVTKVRWGVFGRRWIVWWCGPFPTNGLERVVSSEGLPVWLKREMVRFERLV